MKRLQRLLVSVLAGMIATISICSNVFADTIPTDLGMVIDGSLLTNDEFSESVEYNPARGNILNRGVARISNNGNGTVNVYGAVMAGVVCDKLQLEMSLQRLEGGYWQTIKTFSDTSYGQALLTKSYNQSVKSGYYYRVKAACIATDAGTSESQMPVTNGLWI